MTRGAFIGCVVIAAGLFLPAASAAMWLMSPIRFDSVWNAHSVMAQVWTAAALGTIWLAIFPIWTFGARRRLIRRARPLGWSLMPGGTGLFGVAVMAAAAGFALPEATSDAALDCTPEDIDRAVAILEEMHLAALTLMLAALIALVACSIEALRPDVVTDPSDAF